MYTIKKDGLYVSWPGRKESYTNDPDYAVKYETYEEAKRNACGDELVIKMQLQLKYV